MRYHQLMLFGAVLCAFFIASGSSTPTNIVEEGVQFVEKEWAKFKAAAHRVYPTVLEEAKRFGIFVENLRIISKHQGDYKNGTTTFEQHINDFADLTNEEFSKERNGFNQTVYEELYGNNNGAASTSNTQKSRSRRDLSSWFSNFPSIHDFMNGGSSAPIYVPKRVPKIHNRGSSSSSSGSGSSVNVAGLPSQINWVTKGAVTPIIDQGRCGGCWAIATAEALEGLQFTKTGKLVPLSPQQLLDCSHNGGNDGCDGGVLKSALTYIEKTGGLVAASDYPYVAAEQRCQQSRLRRPLQTVSGMQPIANGDARGLMKTLATGGPVMVAIDGSQSAFQFYKGGIYADRNCQAGVANHAVLLVGYGTDATTGLDYWLVKNSWGTGWGENGYVRIVRNSQYNDCCVTCYGLYPTD